MGRTAFLLLAAANVAVLFSIFASQTLLGLALAVLLLSRQRLEAPRLLLPISLFIAWTLLSLALAPQPLLGLAQVKKFYIFLILIAAYTVFRNLDQVDRVLRAVFAAGAIAAVLATIEFGLYWASLHTARDFYSAYSKARITGFMGHWQTFSGEQMLVLAMLASFLLFAQRRPRWIWVAASLIALSLLLAFTRGVWLGCLAAGTYLLWEWRRRWVLVAPAALLALYLMAPGVVQTRIRSLVDIRADSSNAGRLMMTRTGLNMVRQHPLFGVGPNGVLYYFEDYRPAGPKPDAWYGHLHSNYLQIAAERGLPALGFFLWILIAAFRQQRRTLRSIDSGYRYIPQGISASIIAMTVAGAFEYNFGDSEVAMLLLFYLSHGATAARNLQSSTTGATACTSTEPRP